MTSDDSDDDMSPGDAASHIEERQEWFAHAKKSTQTGTIADCWLHPPMELSLLTHITTLFT
eukprot:7640168-Karenia_brevis.AAC.1